MATTIVGFSDNNNNNTSFFSSSDSSHIDDDNNNPSEILTGLQLLSNCLELMFDSPESFYSDAKLVIGNGREISFHRCVLSARSSVFKTALTTVEQKSKSAVVKLDLKEIAKDYEVGFDSVVTVLAYFYSGRVRLFPVKEGGLCCMDQDCCHVACRPVVDFMVEVLYLAFVFQIPELMTMYERHFMEIVDKVVVEDTFVIFKLVDICGEAYKKLLDKCIEIIVKSNIESVSLDKSLPQHIVKQIIEIRKEFGFEPLEVEKHVVNIYKALDSDDVELVKMLLTEGHTNLDDAYALHYAATHCDVKTAMDLLDLEELANVNHKNQRGYTVLHVAAMRMEPKLIVSSLMKGANASETTFDGRTALMIVKQLTKRDGYNTTTEPGKPSLKAGLCIEVLEQALANKLDPFPRDGLLSFPVTPDELKMRLLYLENRVALARVLFPVETKVVTDVAQVEGTREFTSSSLEHDRAERTLPDLNTIPIRIQEEHLSRLIALSKTVELGKRYFPRCSLSHFMDMEDFAHFCCIDTPEKRLQKKQRYMELQETLMKTFSEDKEEFRKSSKSKSTAVMRSRRRRLRVDKRKF